MQEMPSSAFASAAADLANRRHGFPFRIEPRRFQQSKLYLSTGGSVHGWQLCTSAAAGLLPGSATARHGVRRPSVTDCLLETAFQHGHEVHDLRRSFGRRGNRGLGPRVFAPQACSDDLRQSRAKLVLVLRRTPVASHRLDQLPPARATRANRFGRRAWRAARAVARRCRLLPVALRLVIVVALVPVRFTVVARELVDGGGRRRLQLRLRVVHDVGIFCFVVMQR